MEGGTGGRRAEAVVTHEDSWPKGRLPQNQEPGPVLRWWRLPEPSRTNGAGALHSEKKNDA